MSANPSWTNVPRHTTNFNPKIFISHIPVLNFAGTTRKQMTPRMCANPEPRFQRYTTKPQTLRPKIFISHICFELCRSSSPYYTTHVSQPILNQRPKTHCKLQIRNFHLTHPCFELCRNRLHLACVPTLNKCGKDTPDPKIFISHIPQNLITTRFSSHTSLFWTLPEQLSILHHACVPTILNQRLKTHTNFRSQNFHLTHPCFELCRNRLHLACVPTLNKCGKDTPQNLRPQDFHLTHPSFELCRSSSPYYTTHVCQPILNQPPKTHYKVQIRKFSSHTSLFWTLPEQLGADDTTHVCQPLNQPQDTQDPKISSHSTHLFWTSDPKIFMHTSLLNFAGAALHITPRMCANPSWTNVPRHTTNFRSENFHLTHPCFELCRNNSEQMTPRNTTHVCQPWTNVPKIHHKTSDPKT